MHNKFWAKQSYVVGKLSFLMFAFVLVLISSVTYAKSKAASIAQGYTTSDTSLVTGMAASLSTESGPDSQIVERSSVANKTRFVGIVTTKDANLVTLSNPLATVIVATAGEVVAFATDASGQIKKGDNLSISPLKGILARTTPSDSNVVGIALEDYSEKLAQKHSLRKTDGTTLEASIAMIHIEINQKSLSVPAHNNNSFIKTIGQNIAGRTISNWQAVTALVIFLLLIVLEGALVNGSIRNTTIALGRNPLAHDSIYKQLFQVILVALVILAFGLATIYFILQI